MSLKDWSGLEKLMEKSLIIKKEWSKKMFKKDKMESLEVNNKIWTRRGSLRFKMLLRRKRKTHKFKLKEEKLLLEQVMVLKYFKHKFRWPSSIAWSTLACICTYIFYQGEYSWETKYSSRKSSPSLSKDILSSQLHLFSTINRHRGKITGLPS